MDFSFIRYTSMMFTLTAMQIRELHGTIKQSQLNAVIRTHQETLKCFDYLQKALNLAVLFQFAFCSVIWCLMLLYILMMGFDAKIINVSILLMLLTCGTYAYCQLATELTETSLEVLRALEELSWYEQSLPVQKGILFMIQSAQRPIVLTAAKLIPINIAQFSEIVKKSYSVYVVLKDIF
ncbi:odorant receptor 7a-like [Anopheles ziemanni]|uniref:odorant receptor 7a-like n=1 Tax=Anopheles coustani TaxID=139045 RepID=UPI002659B703|nr:odorant receptor 7a-like [Anopheles coustani]XP_058178913.1 odorant receptor 7a-like [Anopheles ziemanni]